MKNLEFAASMVGFNIVLEYRFFVEVVMELLYKILLIVHWHI